MNALWREAMRYLGARLDDPLTQALIADCFDALMPAGGRHVLRIERTADVVAAFGSEALARHLEGTDTAALLAATLGAEADRLIRAAEAVDTLRATALHAAAAAKIEAYCDRVQAGVPGANRPRFSPGYGDFQLEKQRVLLHRVDAGRRIGLFLTEGLMLAPTKSVTAVLGIGPPLPGCPAGKCARCGKTDCAFRRG